MQIEVLTDEAAVARRTAEVIERATSQALARKGRATLGLSGGSTPAPMLERLGAGNLDWRSVHLFQVDERVAPDGHIDRNWTMLSDSLLTAADIPRRNLHPMPVTAQRLDEEAAAYGRALEDLCGVPPALDVVHLGIGADGHTASLIPGDPVLQARDRWVALAGPYQGRRRMTLTYPVINAARLIVWQVVGADKAHALREGLQGTTVPASAIRRDGAIALADTAAAGLLHA